MNSHDMIVALVAVCTCLCVALIAKAIKYAITARKQRAVFGISAEPTLAANITFRFTSTGHDEVRKAFDELAESAKRYEAEFLKSKQTIGAANRQQSSGAPMPLVGAPESFRERSTI